jgi:hypothetical protein
VIPGINNTDGLDSETVELVQQYLQEMAVEEAMATDERMAAIGRFNQDGARSLNGVGEVASRFDLGHFFIQSTLQGANPRDPDFKPWLAKQAGSEYARVKCAGTKALVGFRGDYDLPPRDPKFHKVYASQPTASAAIAA